MKPGSVITLKSDRRYKLGNVVKDKNGSLRGHPETLHMKRYHFNTLEMNLNPPIVISRELADAIKVEEAKVNHE